MPTFTRKKYFELAKGFFGRNKRCLRVMIPRVEKGLDRAYKSRKLRPRDIRSEWITNISAAVKEHSINYNRFIYGLNLSNMEIDRKILANLAYTEPFSFKAIVDEVKIQGKIIDREPKQPTYQEAVEMGLLVETKPIEKPNIPEPFPFSQNHPIK